MIQIVDCEEKEELDWLAPPPKVSTNAQKMLGEDSTIKKLRYTNFLEETAQGTMLSLFCNFICHFPLLIVLFPIQGGCRGMLFSSKRSRLTWHLWEIRQVAMPI